MENEVKKFNTMMIINGVLLVIIGLMCIVWRAASMATIAIFIGAGFFAVGIIGIIDYVSNIKLPGITGWMLFEAILDILVGLAFLVNPLAAGVGLTWLVAIAVFIGGIMQLFAAFSARRAGGRNWWLFIVSGIITVIFGILLFIYPGLMVLLIGIFALVRGVYFIVGGFSFKKACDSL